MSASRSTDLSANVFSVLATVAVVLVVWAALWSGVRGVASLVVGSPIDILLGVVISLLPIASIGVVVRDGRMPLSELAGAVAVIAGTAITFITVVGLTTLFVVSPFGGRLAVMTAAWVVLGLTGGVALWTPVVVGTIGSASPRALLVRMIAASALLVIVFGWLLLFVWGSIFLLVGLATTIGTGIVAATALTGGLTAWIGYREYTQVETLEHRADATPTTADDLPDLHAATARIAAQLDVPMPTIAISRTHAPEAMVVGFRPGNTHLVLSYGAVTSLSDAELDAVIAHELAHVTNRDAMVMTVLSLPVVLADAFRMWIWDHVIDRRDDEVATEPLPADGPTGSEEWSDDDLLGPNNEWQTHVESERDDDRDDNISILLWAIMTMAWMISRAIVSLLSRTRETAADRTAAEVTGEPVALAGALWELDEQIETTPTDDLREVASVSSMSILPIDPSDRDAPGAWPLPESIERLRDRLFRSHPPTEQRVETLETLARDRE